ncbi:UNVERIFIED_CONTAM: hypothetical protein K2H54_036523 [Gekko kuhli]
MENGTELPRSGLGVVAANGLLTPTDSRFQEIQDTEAMGIIGIDTSEPSTACGTLDAESEPEFEEGCLGDTELRRYPKTMDGSEELLAVPKMEGLQLGGEERSHLLSPSFQ